MTIVATFDPSATSSGQFNTKLPFNGKFLLTNQSNINLTLTFADGSTVYAPAWQIGIFQIPTATPNVKWNQQSLLAGSSPISQVTIDSYLPNEPILGTYPVAIQHTAYVPNQVSTALGGATSVQNDGNAATTVFIEATQSGSPSSNVNIDNTGNMFIAQTVGGVVSKLFQVIANASTCVILGLAGKLVQIAGNLLVIGSSSLDNGNLTTDGNGNLTTVSISNSSGVVRGIQALSTSYQFANSAVYTFNTPVNVTIAGNGGIPSNARGVWISGYGQSTSIGAYLAAYMTGLPNNNPSNLTLIFQTQGVNQLDVGNGYVPLDGSGRLTIIAGNATITNTNLSVYAYLS